MSPAQPVLNQVITWQGSAEAAPGLAYSSLLLPAVLLVAQPPQTSPWANQRWKRRRKRQGPRSSNKKLTHDFPHSLWVLVWLLLGKSSLVSSPPRKWTKLQPLRFLHTYSAQFPAPSSLHPSLKTEKTQQRQMGESASYGGIHPTRLGPLGPEGEVENRESLSPAGELTYPHPNALLKMEKMIHCVESSGFLKQIDDNWWYLTLLGTNISFLSKVFWWWLYFSQGGICDGSPGRGRVFTNLPFFLRGGDHWQLPVSNSTNRHPSLPWYPAVSNAEPLNSEK